MDHQEILENIASGLYKIVDKKGKSEIWTTFGDVQRENGNILMNLVYCRICERLFKFNGKQTSNLIRHKCHAIKRDVFKSLNESTRKAKTKSQKAHTESDDEKEFKWTNEDDGGIVSSANASKQKVALKTYPRKAKQQSDEDEEEFKWSNEYDEPEQIEWRKIDIYESPPPPPPEPIYIDHSEKSQDFTQHNITKNIDSGTYKIIKKKNVRSDIWTIFGEIQNKNGKILKDLVCCRLCKRIMKFTGAQTSNLNRHKCYSNKKGVFIPLNATTLNANVNSNPDELHIQSEEEESKWENDNEDDVDSNISNADASKQTTPLQIRPRKSKRQSEEEKEFQWSNDDDDPLQCRKESSPPPPANKRAKTPANDRNEQIMIVDSRSIATSQVKLVADNSETSKDSKDEATVYAEGWAFTYRKMSTAQQIFAKQAIDEILSRGRMEELKFNYLSSYPSNSAPT